MLEHYHNPPKDEAISVDRRMERYLDTLCETLAETLTEEQRREYRAEMRDHLEAMIEAHQELGASPAEAVERALEQFGKAQKVAIAWEDTVELPERVSLRQALRAPMRWFGAGMLAWMVMFQILIRLDLRVPNHIHDLMVMFWIIGMPLFAGIGTGLTTRGRPVLGTLATLIPMHLMLPLYYWISTFYWHEGAVQTVWLQCFSWSLVGATTAWLTHKERRRKWRMRRRA